MQGDKIKVLLVESCETTQAEFEVKFANSENFVIVKTTNNESEALDFLAKANLDVVITEVKLRQGDGINLICDIKEMYEKGDLKINPYIVAITHNQSNAMTKMLNCYADNWFDKFMDDFGADLVIKHLNRAKEFFGKVIPRKEVNGANTPVAGAPMDKEHALRKHVKTTIINRLSISPDLNI